MSFRCNPGILCLVAGLVYAGTAAAQSLPVLTPDGLAPTASATGVTPLFSLQRSLRPSEQQSQYLNDALSINLGLQVNPVNALSVRADAWRLELAEAPASALLGNGFSTGLPQLVIEAPATSELAVEQPGLPSGIQTSGIDLGASYVFETNKAGQFTLSTKATFVYDFRQSSALLESGPLATPELPGNADLQGSLTLTWDFGNHSASASTNYFDSFKDLSELNIDEINRLVDDIVTLDLQYGYSIKTGKQERAVFSFGIRNVFDTKTTQILNSNSRIVDQNGRVAYGSIKYQF